MRGFGPFAMDDPGDRLILLQLFPAIVTMSGLILAAVIHERNIAERRRAADHAVTHALAGSASLVEVTPRILRAVGESLGDQADRRGAPARCPRRAASAAGQPAPALVPLLLLLVFLGAWGGSGVDRPAWADHTGVMQLNDRVGPYVVRAFSEPDPPRTDRCRIIVTVLQPGGQRPVPTADVSVSASLAGGRAARVSIAPDRTRDPQQVYYVADLALPAAGRWTVTVRVSGPEGAGSAAFPLDVETASWRAGPVMLAAGGAALGLGLAAVWLLRRSRRRRG